MDDIVTKDGIFKYRWYPEYVGLKGCEVCSLKDDEYCPKEKCTKDGCYGILSERERKYERLSLLIREQHPNFGKKHRKNDEEL